ncbi:MAG: hypothetical protein ACR2JU_03485 [Nocardioidaceae bacterium]
MSASGGAPIWRGEDEAGDPRGSLRHLWLPFATSALLVVAFLALPLSGTDLSAAVARADFAADHAFAPIDFSWFGGTNQFGYSLVSQYLMALLGARPAGALAAFAASCCFATVLRRSSVARPLAGALVGTFCIFANLVSGRITFAIGTAFGLACLLALGARSKRLGLPLAALLAVLCAGSSPVAGLFLLLCGVALALTGKVREGVLLAAGTVIPMVVIGLLFGQGGWMQMSVFDVVKGVVTSLAVAALIPLRQVRVGALLCVAGIVVAYAVHTPIGANAIRLPVMFALPLIVGLCPRPRLQLLGIAGLVAVLNPPLVLSDLGDTGDPASYPTYYAQLNARLATLPQTGKVEVVMTPNYWESVYVADKSLLARGWLRQQDTAQNPLFFKDRAPSAAAYQRWLVRNGVAYVALPSEVSWLGEAERRAVHRTAAAAGAGSLSLIWGDERWQLYSVTGSPGLVDGPATVIRANQAVIALRFSRPGSALIRVNYNRWLVAAPDACLADAHGWTRVRASEAGPVRISSSLRPTRPAEPC